MSSPVMQVKDGIKGSDRNITHVAKTYSIKANGGLSLLGTGEVTTSSGILFLVSKTTCGKSQGRLLTCTTL